MATLLDLGSFSFFGSIFTFILVWIIVYALLEYTKAFGPDKKGINGLVALSVAILVLASKFALEFINFIVPWFLILAVVIFLIIFIFRIFGATDFTGAVGEVRMWIITLAIIILLFGFGNVFGQSALEEGTGLNESDSGSSDNGNSGNSNNDNDAGPTDTGSFSQNVYNTLFHPKILGLIVILIVGILALVFLTGRN